MKHEYPGLDEISRTTWRMQREKGQGRNKGRVPGKRNRRRVLKEIERRSTSREQSLSGQGRWDSPGT